MFRRVGILLVLLTAVTAVARPAAAQATAPDTGMWAVGVSVGAAMPSEELFGTGLTVGVAAERFFTPRVSIRGQISGAFWNFTDFEEDTASPLAINANVVHNWERGALHPYVTAGFGFYNYRLTEAEIDESAGKFGLNLGGGLEYFFSGTDSVTGELLIHVVTGDVEGTFDDYGAGYWSITGGYKKYF
jgi:hypothetical protein